jgi:hypothetical protein
VFKKHWRILPTGNNASSQRIAIFVVTALGASEPHMWNVELELQVGPFIEAKLRAGILRNGVRFQQGNT